MPRANLTDLAIRSLKPGTWFDEKLPAFGIRVGKTTKTWIVMRTQKRIRTTVGHYPALGLADARQKARALLIDAPEPKEPPLPFSVARTRYLEAHTGRPSTVKELTRLLTKHFVKLDEKDLPAITDRDVSQQLASLKPSEALHAFRAIRAMMRWCVRPPRRYVAHSPLEGYAPPGQDGRKTRVLTDTELTRILAADTGQSAAIVKLMLLWGTRKGETLALRRDWIDGDILTIPAAATKNGRPHTIPILPLAQSVLDSLPKRGLYFFPGRYDQSTHLAEGSWTKMHREVLKASSTSSWSSHDCRRTFRSACARFGVSRDLAERLLNHAQGALDEIYDHHTYVTEKRDALQKIEKWVTGLLPKPNVPPAQG